MSALGNISVSAPACSPCHSQALHKVLLASCAALPNIHTLEPAGSVSLGTKRPGPTRPEDALASPQAFRMSWQIHHPGGLTLANASLHVALSLCPATSPGSGGGPAGTVPRAGDQTTKVCWARLRAHRLSSSYRLAPFASKVTQTCCSFWCPHPHSTPYF